MADFLTAVSTKKVRQPESLIKEIGTLDIRSSLPIDSAVSALEALKNQPDHGTVKNALNFLTSDGFSLFAEPLNASIAHQLVNDTIPNYWRPLKDSTQGEQLATVLRNPIGLGHLITRLRTLLADSRQKKTPDQSRHTLEHIEDAIDLFDRILRKDQTSRLVLGDVLINSNVIQRQLMWREYLSQIASGRVLSLVAEAEDILNNQDMRRVVSWMANGTEFAAWLGRNVVGLVESDDKREEYTKSVTELCSKVLGLGYTGSVVASLVSAFIRSDRVELLTDMLSRLKGFEQRKYFNAVIDFLVKYHFSTDFTEKENALIPVSKAISGAASFIFNLIRNNAVLREYLVSSLTRSTIPSLEVSLSARRSAIAALAKDEDSMQTLLEDSIKLFGDSVYVRHTPVLQQEALAQTLAICCGYVHRTQPMYLVMMAKSTYQVNGISNRIGAVSARARFLGIAVGVAISRLVDKADLQLKFELEGAEATEAQWYQRLTEVNDPIGSIADLKVESAAPPSRTTKPSQVKTQQRYTSSEKSAITEIQGPRVIEILSGSEDEDDDLVSYEKPDSDPEDDGDDPETINRNKPTAPVYIRDLISGLRDHENYDRHELALATAAGLIRRKANFGTEVTDHLQELATILTGLQDNLELESFTQQKQQALIAVLLAKPAQMAQWFAQSFFSGDYSLTQRIAMLTTLGLGARELAGLKDSSTDDLVPAQSSFPSKQLPPTLHKMYTPDASTNPTAKITSSMAREMLSPLASQAVDQLSGPNILKVRTFSSRMEVEKKRQKPIANALAQIVADNFFFPLTGRWWIQVRANSDSIYTSTHLLPPFLQTLSLLLNASGPNTLSLPQMTREYWDLLLSVRGLASKDKNVLSAVLFGFLMLLETNENKERLATEQGKELMETQAWVKVVFEGLAAGSEEDEKVRVLAAGVVVRCQEVVEKYQRRMVGALMDY